MPMLSPTQRPLVVALLTLLLAAEADAWGRRRRRPCYGENCQRRSSGESSCDDDCWTRIYIIIGCVVGLCLLCSCIYFCYQRNKDDDSEYDSDDDDNSQPMLNQGASPLAANGYPQAPQGGDGYAYPQYSPPASPGADSGASPYPPAPAGNPYPPAPDASNPYPPAPAPAAGNQQDVQEAV